MNAAMKCSREEAFLNKEREKEWEELEKYRILFLTYGLEEFNDKNESEDNDRVNEFEDASEERESEKNDK